MNDKVYMPYYIADFLRDTRSLSPAEKGIWNDLLLYMWISPTRGKLTDSLEGYSRMVGATVEQAERVLSELIMKGICDAKIDGESVTCNANVTLCNKNVTIINRRMYREAQKRVNTKERVKNYREKKKCNGQCNTDVTGDSSYLKEKGPPKGGPKKKIPPDEVQLLIDEFGKDVIDTYLRRIALQEKSSGKAYADRGATIRLWLDRDGVKPITTPEKKPVPQYDIEAYSAHLTKTRSELIAWFGKSILPLLSSELDEHSFSAWFKPLIPLQIENRILTLFAPDAYYASWIGEHYDGLLKKVLKEARCMVEKKEDRERFPVKHEITAEVPEEYQNYENT